jgi:hypothetical protein
MPDANNSDPSDQQAARNPKRKANDGNLLDENTEDDPDDQILFL